MSDSIRPKASFSSLCSLVIVSMMIASSTWAQVELHEIYGDSVNDRFGRSVDGIGDLNGDGLAEFIVASGGPFAPTGGYARVYSGLDASVLHDLNSPFPGSRESVVAGGGDVNADGTPDFAVGSPWATASAGTRSGSICVYSGFDGAVLHTLEGEAIDDLFGSRLSLSADLNGDGRSDVLGVSTRDVSPTFGSGVCRVFSGIDGSVLLTIEEPTIARFATTADFAGDANGDGVPDLAIGSFRDDDSGQFRGSVRMYSGADGSLLWTVYGDTPSGEFGESLSAAGDVDLDGYEDVIVGAFKEPSSGLPPMTPNLPKGYAKVLSGLDGSEIFHFETADPMVRLVGGEVSGPGDVNRDGYPDLLVQTNEGYIFVPIPFQEDIYDYIRSGARLYSGRDGSVLQEYGNGSQFEGRVVTLEGAEDVNGDGVLDVLLGQPEADLNYVTTGGIRVFAGVADEFVESCSGDGGDQMGCTNCPCTNNAAPGTIGGCLNSVGRSAGLLTFGSPSVTMDELRMELTGGTSNAFAILSSGDNLAPANAANPCFGQASGVTFTGFDGLRCTVSNVQRHGTRATDGIGSAGLSTPGWGAPDGPPSGLVAQGGFVFGQVRHYQVIYREDLTLGCGTGLNSTQAVSVSFVP